MTNNTTYTNPKWMKKPLWKWLGIILFTYVLIGGMTVPLKPGLTLVTPDKIVQSQDVTLTIRGYNTHFDEANNYAWLKLDDTHLLKARETRPIDANNLEALFQIPDAFPSSSKNAFMSLLVYNEVDGPSIRPSAVYVSDFTEGPAPEWQGGFDMQIVPKSGIQFPFRTILDETIRNTFFHVALWLAMVCLLIAGLYQAIMYLRTKNMHHDRLSAALTIVSILYGLLGLATGSIWARFTWGTWWTSDIKLNMAAISMLIYLAYLVLRSANEDHEKRARLSAVYNIFAFALLIPLIFVIPRLTSSLHPGNGGNPALGGEDLENTLRLFFYPSIIALILLGTWMASLIYRTYVIEDKVMSQS